MQLQKYIKSVELNEPPQLSIHLLSLWYDAKGDWHKAHSLVDSLQDETACWVHAYLHRKEGDLGNAGYWYRNAGKPMPVVSLQQEWEQIVNALL
jgi:hypothetical protein